MGYREEIYDALKVQPETLIQGISEARQITGNMRNLLGGMERAAERSGRYWKGKAGDEHRAYFFRLKQNGERILSGLGNSIADLEQITASYTRTERAAAERVEALPGDVIQ